jgi:hypothetical protein
MLEKLLLAVTITFSLNLFWEDRLPLTTQTVNKSKQITASGTVPSAGWSNPQLAPYTYVQAPPDGIYDFDFVATPPKEFTGLPLIEIFTKT